jgi:hypothetical protein
MGCWLFDEQMLFYSNPVLKKARGLCPKPFVGFWAASGARPMRLWKRLFPPLPESGPASQRQAFWVDKDKVWR